MNNTPTWLILTDGYFIRIMIKKDADSGLRTLRDGDFEHTSEITYNLVTHKRNMEIFNDEGKYFLELLSDFLTKQCQNNSFKDLIIIAPANVLEELQDYLPENIKGKIMKTVEKDFLAVSQDILEEYVANNIE